MDSNGLKLERRSEAMIGRYFEMVSDSLHYQKELPSKVIVPKACFLCNLPPRQFGSAKFNGEARIVISSEFIGNIKQILKLDY